MGRSGLATAKYLAERGARVIISDAAAATETTAKQADELMSLHVDVEFGGHTEKALTSASLIVTSPGVPPHSKVMQDLRALAKEVICDVELAFRETRTPVIAITGTNGKSTTCALVSFLLEKSGRVAPACGNIGVPILSQLDKQLDFIVVEVSSYQLHYCSAFSPQIGVWLNLTPDHLDWHGGITEYIHDKAKLFANQRPDQYAVLNVDDAVVAKTARRSEVFPFSVNTELSLSPQGAFMSDEFLCIRRYGKTIVICAEHELKVFGRHNLENALAAVSASCLAGLGTAEIEKYIKEFAGLEHRLEFVATIDGVDYYNDSKATNPESAIKALEAFPDRKVVLIAGGRDKGTSLGDFVHSVRNHAMAVILIGEARERFEKALKDGGVSDIHPVGSMEEAVDLGARLKLGPVLLSPACASFDMFTDFENRGRVFKDIVRARANQVAPPV